MNFTAGNRKVWSQRLAFAFLPILSLVFAIALFTPVLSTPVSAASRAIVSRVPPSYPEIAKRMKISGSVKIEVTIDADGKVSSVKTLSGNHMLSPSAEDAVKRWKFEPGDGVSTQEIEVNFALAQ